MFVKKKKQEISIKLNVYLWKVTMTVIHSEQKFSSFLYAMYVKYPQLNNHVRN